MYSVSCCAIIKVGLQQSIENFTDTQLANFCRILSVTISDLDVYENKASRKCFCYLSIGYTSKLLSDGAVEIVYKWNFGEIKSVYIS